MTEATVKDFNGADFSMNTVFYNIDDKRTLNSFELVSESEKDVVNPIYIPLYVSNFGGFVLNEANCTAGVTAELTNRGISKM